MKVAGPGRLADRVCLVTGATGIAAAAAVRFGLEGAAVVVASLHAVECRELAAAVEATGARCTWVAGDLREEAASAAAVARCREEYGDLDAVFAVAGGSGRSMGDGPLHDIPLAGWDATMSLNTTPAFLITREALRMMLEADAREDGTRGSVVLVSSVLAASPARPFSTHAYAAAKAALLGLTRSAAAYYAPSLIRINAVAPGLVATPMAARAANDPDIVSYAERKQPLAGGLLAAEDIADAALFLLSPEARRITGQVLTVDGGWSVTEA